MLTSVPDRHQTCTRSRSRTKVTWYGHSSQSTTGISCISIKFARWQHDCGQSLLSMIALLQIVTVKNHLNDHEWQQHLGTVLCVCVCTLCIYLCKYMSMCSYVDKLTEFLRLFVSVHLPRFERNPQFPIIEFLSVLFSFTFQQVRIASSQCGLSFKLFFTFIFGREVFNSFSISVVF